MQQLDFDTYLKKFRAFRALHKSENPFYVFFTTELLFWAVKSLSFVPDDVNVILIGAGLTDEEKRFLDTRVNRPLFLIDEYCDDNDAWKLIFDGSESDFGWMDIDCFVFNPGLFYEMTRMDGETAINCAFSCRGTGNPDIVFLNSYFLFVNADVRDKLTALGYPLSPRTYIYSEKDKVIHTHSDILTQTHKNVVGHYFADGVYPGTVEIDFFDTMLLYQLIARHHGYRLALVRDQNPDNYFSNDVIHIGGSSNFSKPHAAVFDLGPMKDHAHYLMIAYNILSQSVSQLPAHYTLKRKQLRYELFKMGVQEDKIADYLMTYMRAQNLSEETIERLLT
ncbi:MAG: hypothetical protein LBV27_07830 [Oscillospiraceae bacterium]|jgi:hypothetical protein|nr:hypothetical protein [Oscillospiraceae bacterium]